MSNTIMVRPATLDDVPALIPMGARFYEASRFGDLVEFDDGSFSLTARHLIENAQGILLVAEDDGARAGMAAGLVFPFYFNVSAICAQELFWWAERNVRAGVGTALLDGLEATARHLGARVMIASAVSGLRDQAVAALYARRGYRAADNSFIKQI